MQTPLPEDETLIPTLLREQWQLAVAQIHFIPQGESAYSYSVETQPHNYYYLKIVDQRLPAGRRTAMHMNFSLPLQRFIAEQHLAEISAPLPQRTVTGALQALHGPFLFALYTFIPGETLANAYPFSPPLIGQIGRALAVLHTVQLPKALRQRAPQDQLTEPFDAALLANLASLEDISVHDERYLQRLREIIWPQREPIRAFLTHSQEYEAKAQRTPVSPVVCHGDPWGGNLIPTSTGQLTFLDWDTSVIAPPERDAFIYTGYIGLDFTAFDAGYRLIHKEPLRWHANWLAYYAYRLQLRNLSHWLHALLHEPLNAVQRDHNIEMIRDHCLDRLASVERTAATLATTLDL